VLLVAQRWDHGRQLQAERAHSSTLLANIRELTDQIVLLKVNPVTAAAVTAANVEPPGDYLSLSDDEALAEYELERNNN
jgi:hypothetical protein